MDTSQGDEGILVGGASLESPSGMTLVMTVGSDAPRAFDLGERQRTFIGREHDCELVLDDQRVQHEVQPIRGIGGPGYRDMLILDFEEVRGGHEPG